MSIAFVLLVYTFSIFCKVIFHESLSTSHSTGVAPDLITADKQEIIVKEGRITSSPFFKLIEFRAKSKATDPLLTFGLNTCINTSSF